VGGFGSGFAVVWTMLTTSTVGWAAALLSQPAAWSVPSAFLTMWLVSLATRDRVPPHVHRFMVRLHTPETAQLDRG
jgi:cation/acetate symporter